MKNRLALVVALFAASVLLFTAAGSVFAEEAAPPEVAKGHEFIGVNRCKPCHKAYFEAWEKTAHAQAFAKLDPAKGEDKNPACVKCHVTGFAEGGYAIDGSAKADLKNVQCEACHGAGGDYWKIPVMKDREKSIAAGLVHPVTADVCTKCHNAESPTFKGFEFDKAKATGVHAVEKKTEEAAS